MAGAVGAATGIVSTVAGMGEQSRQRNIASQQAKVQQYAQEVQYEQEKMAIRQQQEYARQTRSIEQMQLAAQDLQLRNSLTEQAMQARTEEQTLGYQLSLKQIQDESALQTANQALQLAEFQQGEMYRQRAAAADNRQQEVTGQVSQQQAEITKYLAEGKNTQAAALMMNATQGQQDSLTSDIQTDRRDEIANTLNVLMQQGGLTEEAVRQALYEKDVASTLQQAGLYDIALERIGAQSQYDVNTATGRAQRDLLETGKRKNAIGEDLASKTLEGGISLRDQQRGIDAKFSDMGFTAQADNAGIRNASIMSSLQAQQASSRGSLFTSLANAASLAGAGYNAYQTMKPITPYSSPVVNRANNSEHVTGGTGTSRAPYTANKPQYGPALPQVGPYGPVDIRR